MKQRWVAGDFLPILGLIALAAFLQWGSTIYDYVLPAAAPELAVVNPKGRDSATGQAHWIAGWCYVHIHYRNSRRSAWPFELSMEAQADPADPNAPCLVALVSPAKTVQSVTLRGRQVLHFPVMIGPGRNQFTLWALWPDRAPGDAGDRMLRISALRLNPAGERRP
jgi:hypothetical protein